MQTTWYWIESFWKTWQEHYFQSWGWKSSNIMLHGKGRNEINRD